MTPKGTNKTEKINATHAKGEDYSGGKGMSDVKRD